MKKMIPLNAAGALLIGALLSFATPAKAQQTHALITHFPALIGSKTNISLAATPDQGILFSWIENGKHVRSFFDKAGVWTGSVVTYEESGLPELVQRQVKNEYSRYTIRFVDEIRLPEHEVVYRVHLENARELVFAKVQNGEIFEEDRLVKSL